VADSPYPPLPDSVTPEVRLLTVSGDITRRYSIADTVSAAIEVADPDAVLAVPPDANLAAQRLMQAVSLPDYTVHRGMRNQTHQSDNDSVVVVFSPEAEQLPVDPAAVLDSSTGKIEGAFVDILTERTVCLVTDRLSMHVDPHERETTIDGLAEYCEAVPAAWLHGDIKHFSTRLQTGYGQSVETSSGAMIEVYGLGDNDGRLGAAVDTTTQQFTVVDIYANGAVATEAIAPKNVGLRSLPQVGDARANAFVDAGISDTNTIVELDCSDVIDITGVNRDTATTIQAAATATAEGRVVRTSTATLPSADPIYIDIETDGLSASVAWLIGVLDGDAEDGSYYPFRQRDPTDQRDHLEAFLLWLQGTDRQRPLVAWNGYRFDFDILGELIREHCPDHAETWEHRRTVDPLFWARNQDNALLPGRTNKLEHVAAALGYHGSTPALDGKLVAQRYTTWREHMRTCDDPMTVPAPSWERLERYCEDDVRALATIYEAMRNAPIDDGVAESAGSRGQQGSLSDFG
jgi:uncharacterized protein YprB with RNaseH-like and TPR domain